MDQTLRASDAPLSPISKFLQDQLSPILAFAYQLLVLVCFAALPFWAYQAYCTPFIGAFVGQTLVLTTAAPVQPGSWGAQKLALPFGAQISMVDGESLHSAAQLEDALRHFQPGERVEVTFRLPEGDTTTQEIRLQRLPLLDLAGYFAIPYLAGLISLVTGLYVFGLRRREPAGRAFALFTAAVALSAGGLFDLYSTHHLTYLWTFSLALAGGALFNFAMLFPEEIPWVRRFPFLRWLGYIPVAGLALAAYPTLYRLSQPMAYLVVWRLEMIFSGLVFGIFLGLSLYRRFHSSSPVRREQSRLILLGSLLSFGPLALYFFLAGFLPSVRFSPFLLLSLGAFPVMVAYAILRYRSLNTDALISQGILYTTLSILVAAGYGFLASGLSLVFGESIRPTNPYLIGLVVFLLVVLLKPLRLRMQNVVDQAFARGQAATREQLQSFGHELTEVMELPAILRLLRKYAQEGLDPTQLHIFIHDPLSNQYASAADENGQTTSDLRFPAGSALVQELARRGDSLFLEDVRALPATIAGERARLALLGSQLYVPLPGRQALIGWLALGPRRSGEPYSTGALDFLESLSDQSALAIERAQVVTDLERRVREMNVLTRVAQGVNFTVAFDDILELIYAQTNLVIPTRDFRVTLYDKNSGVLQHAFFLENDERLIQRENVPLPDGQGLEPEVVRSQRPLGTDDYERQCRSLGVIPESKGLYAWMGVPLTAGAETIGVVSLGSRDPAVVFTDEQRNLLQAIADQGAGAIVKARLLLESEQRARQLATLNEIGRDLTSTLELTPLLNRILNRAAEMINCEAGSLFLVDPQTDELVFEVVIGPVASDLVGKRLPPGKGVVGEAVETRRAVIANDARRRKEWFDQPDEQTGFATQDLMAVPLQLKDRVVGVIEVINKADGSSFNQGDQDLLTTFASQATIAIENARLYTLTDQALAARVEELSIMQRIDRELNTSLDIDRTLRITLDWAMRQSGAEAGLLGMVEEHGVRVMVSVGYQAEIAPYQPDNESQTCLPEDLAGLQRALESGQPANLSAADLSPANEAGGFPADARLLPGARAQAAVPIKREADIIALLFLETAQQEKISPEVMAFLSRLSDHAAIAIANGKLYGEVQAANLAKSKFVSFVAHELKNPMASIKGYTELVANGMAGQINEMQASFLATVRSNVDRMNTIVSDLNDLTKIQVGSLRLEFKAVAVPDLVEEAVRFLRRQLDEKEQTLTVELPPDLPLVWGDQLRLSQILTNLMSNAQKYTGQGGTIFVGAEKRSEGDAALLEFVHVWVKDSGIGIPLEDQDKIFQQYFRTDISKETAAGTGLGLNISKSLVEMQGGRIWFESEPDQGTTFHFTVPVAETV